MRSLKILSNEEDGNRASYSIKYVHTVISNERTCDLVFVIADDNIDA